MKKFLGNLSGRKQKDSSPNDKYAASGSQLTPLPIQQPRKSTSELPPSNSQPRPQFNSPPSLAKSQSTPYAQKSSASNSYEFVSSEEIAKHRANAPVTTVTIPVPNLPKQMTAVVGEYPTDVLGGIGSIVTAIFEQDLNVAIAEEAAKPMQTSALLPKTHTNGPALLFQPYTPQKGEAAFTVYERKSRSVKMVAPASRVKDFAGKYTIISHVWGSDISTIDIKVPGVSWKVPIRKSTPKLNYVLNQLQDEYIWMDVLCINQEYNDDKCAQIQYMGDFYSCASKCLVLLENLTPGLLSSIARLLLQIEQDQSARVSAKPRRLEDDDPQADAQRAGQILTFMSRLSKHEWWNRVWTLQEACLPVRVDLIDISNPGTPIIEDFYTRISQAVDISGRADSTKLLGIHHTGLAIISEWKMGTQYAKQMGSLAVTTLTKSRNCSLPEDKIYGILGLINLKDKINIKYFNDISDRNIRLQHAWAAVNRSVMTEALEMQGLTYWGPSNARASWLGPGPESPMSLLPWKLLPQLNVTFEADGALKLITNIVVDLVDLDYVNVPASMDIPAMANALVKILQFLVKKYTNQQDRITILAQLMEMGKQNEDAMLMAETKQLLNRFATNPTSISTTDVEKEISESPKLRYAAGRVYATASFLKNTGRLYIGRMVIANRILSSPVAFHVWDTALQSSYKLVSTNASCGKRELYLVVKPSAGNANRWRRVGFAMVSMDVGDELFNAMQRNGVLQNFAYVIE